VIHVQLPVRPLELPDQDALHLYIATDESLT